MIYSGDDTEGFYQILALKTYVTRHLFLHVGYQLSKFKDPNNLMLGIGYRFHDKRWKGLWFSRNTSLLNYIYLKIKLQITNRLFINKIEKLQNEYLFTRNVSLMQYKIAMIKSINWKSINGIVSSSWTHPMKTKSDFAK